MWPHWGVLTVSVKARCSVEGTQTHILCEPAQSKRMSRFHKSHFIRKFTGRMPRPRLSPQRRHTFCASLRRQNACQDFTEHAFCASLHSQNARPHLPRDIRRATLHWNLQEKCRDPDWAQEPSLGAHFVRARAVETHVKISEEPLYTAIYRKNAAAQSEHPDQAPAFTLTYRKNPSVWTLLGEKQWKTHIRSL